MNPRPCTEKAPKWLRERAALYRNAASRIEQGPANIWNCACYAIYDLAGKDSPETKAAESDLWLWFGEDARQSGTWFNFWGGNFDKNESVAQDCRVLMLCFMAAMTEAGDA